MLHNEPFTIELTDSVGEDDEIEWEILQDGQRIVKELKGKLDQKRLQYQIMLEKGLEPFEIRVLIVTEEIERNSDSYDLEDTKPELIYIYTYI